MGGVSPLDVELLRTPRHPPLPRDVRPVPAERRAARAGDAPRDAREPVVGRAPRQAARRPRRAASGPVRRPQLRVRRRPPHQSRHHGQARARLRPHGPAALHVVRHDRPRREVGPRRGASEGHPGAAARRAQAPCAGERRVQLRRGRDPRHLPPREGADGLRRAPPRHQGETRQLRPPQRRPLHPARARHLAAAGLADRSPLERRDRFRDRNHSDYIDAVPRAYAKVPWIEIEARAKERAIARLRERPKLLTRRRQ